MSAWIKDTVEFLAYLGAALFFGFKLASGFFIHNLSVSLNLNRSPIKDSDNDTLIISALLEKGNISAITLHDIQVCISYGQVKKSIPFNGFLRCSYETKSVGSTYRAVANTDRLSTSSPLLNLVPGEKTSFSCSAEVPATESIVVELIVIGKRAYIGKSIGQWRSSAVSVPLR